MAKKVANQDSMSYPATWPEVGRFTAIRIVQVFVNDKTPWVGVLVYAIFSLNQHLFIYSLPQSERAARESMLPKWSELVPAFFNESWLCAIGWILFAIALVILVPANRRYWQRIQDQGDELARYRDREDSQRVSSRDGHSLAEYERKMKERYEKNDSSDDR